MARDFGVSESCLQRWLKIADREDGLGPPAAADRGGGARDEAAELRDALHQRGKEAHPAASLPALVEFEHVLRVPSLRHRLDRDFRRGSLGRGTVPTAALRSSPVAGEPAS